MELQSVAVTKRNFEMKSSIIENEGILELEMPNGHQSLV